VGLWPSEGSVSDEVFAIASELGLNGPRPTAGVLNRTVGRAVPGGRSLPSILLAAGRQDG